jgi:succinoglycan biosynthesis protein ExoA
MFVTIIIPTRNSAKYIVSCLDQIEKQDYPKELMEVIVVDGSSSDGTAELVETHAVLGMSIVVVRLKCTGRAIALNSGIKLAKGSAICRLDVRTQIDTNYIKLCVDTLAETKAAAVGGIQVAFGDTITKKSIGIAMTHFFGAGNARYRIAKNSGFVDTVYLGFYRANIFKEVGLFDESGYLISEDSDLNERIRAIGEKIYLNIKIRIGYEPRGSLIEHSRLYYRYGLARSANTRKHRRVSSWRQLVAPAFMGVISLLACLSFFSMCFVYVLVFLVSVYIFSNSVACLDVYLRNRDLRTVPFLFIIFPIMHFSWAFGFWEGMLLPPKRDDHVVV